MQPKRMTQEQIAEAKALYGKGRTFARIAEQLGFSPDSIRRVLDEEYASRRRKGINEARNRRNFGLPPKAGPVHEVRGPRQEDRDARLAEIPQIDRRSLTGVLLGDPLPERSALKKGGRA